DEYDVFEVEVGETDLCGLDWKRCYASHLSRAVTTAETIYKGNIQIKPELSKTPDNGKFYIFEK
ncbi:MAG: hypothetical protein K0S39_5276, partial [Paenibacillus sp.]|nr:hypothetical protein [Paenibacillus sp.]